MDHDDIFCRIIKGEFPDNTVYRDDEVMVIKDIHPQAPVHLLVIPKKHFQSLEDFTENEAALLGKLLLTAEKIAQHEGLKDGYRLIINKGEHGGQQVPHLHIHVLGGKPLGPKIVRD